MKKKYILVYLYKRKYREVDSLIDSMPSYFKIITIPITGIRARAFSVACVPAIVVMDSSGECRIKREGLAMVCDYLSCFRKKEDEV